MFRFPRRRSFTTVIKFGFTFTFTYLILQILNDKRTSFNLNTDTPKPQIVDLFKLPNVSIANENETVLVDQNAAVARLILHKFSRMYFTKLFSDPLSPNWLFKIWHDTAKRQCNGNFIGFGGEVALVYDVTLDKRHLAGKRGGEDFETLINQSEAAEYLKYTRGYFQLKCSSIPVYKFHGKNHLNQLMNSFSKTPVTIVDNIQEDTFIAITRYEYVNLYHTMTDFYNAFLVMNFFNMTQSQTRILFLDGHPWGSLDPVWATLFNSVERAGQIDPRTRFKKLILGYLGYNSPLFTGMSDQSLKVLPLIEEFRNFFLSSYDLPSRKDLDCSRLNVLFIWRRPYLAHPRNPSGDVKRKIKNEDELLSSLRKAHPSWIIIGAQTDTFPMKDQLRLVSQADIMIGMHGAGLSLTLMLPRHSALLELKPNYVKEIFTTHFFSMAKWRGLIYKKWMNTNSTLELPHDYTIVPPSVVLEGVSEIYQNMCPSHEN